MKVKVEINYFMLIVMLAIVAGLCLNLFTLYLLPKGDLQNSMSSPDGKYTLNIYLCNGGATTDFAIRGELVWSKGRKNIYWQYRQDSASVKWLDNTHVLINSVSLDVTKDIYDYRRYE